MKVKNKNILFLFIPLIILMIISLLNMVNAPLLDLTYQNNFLKQLIWYLLGFIICLILTKINTSKILKYSFIFYLISLILLFLVLIFGKDINGARAWFNFKIFSFQPSELMKLSLTLYLVKIANKETLKTKKEELIFILKVFILTLIPSILVFLEPDTGAIIFFILISLSIIILTINHKWWLIFGPLICLLFIGIFILFYLYNKDLLIKLIGTSFFYRIERLITFTNQSSYQLENALTVIGSATLFGTGLKRVSLYIPEAPTDFIFAFTIKNKTIFT